MRRLGLAVLYGSLAAALGEIVATLTVGDPGRILGVVWVLMILWSWWILGDRPTTR
jgi:hypothetical protein